MNLLLSGSMETKLDGSALISVIAPLYNNVEILESFLGELHGCLATRYENFEVVLIDDGSSDGTQRGIESLLKRFDGVRYLRLSRRFGLEISITAGFETAIGDYVVVMLPAVDPVSMVPDVIEKARTSKGGLVIGQVNGNESSVSWLQSKAYNSFYWVCNRWLDLNLIPHTTYFVALDRALLNSLNQIKDKFRYLKSLTTFVGSEPVLYPYQMKAGSKDTWRRGFFESMNLGIDLVVSNSIRPLRIVSLLGLTVSGINLLYFGYIALIALFKQNVAEGWITLSTQMALAFFVLNVVLAVVSEYLGRVLLESKQRPAYFVVEEKNSSVLIVDREKRRNVVGTTIEVMSGGKAV